jgi:hypothetical protein
VTTELPSRRTANMVLLIAGFAVGQGSIFIAQTWLVSVQQFHFLTLFGVHFTFVIMAAGIVDFGSLTTLPRQVTKTSGPSQLWPLFQATCAIRLTASVVLIGLGAAMAVIGGGPFSLPYVMACAPGLAFWSFNAGGILDGLRRSGLTGAATALPYLFSSLALPAAAIAPEAEAGWILGGALSLGLVGATVLTTWGAHRHGGLLFAPVRLSRSLAREAFLDGIAVLLNWLPGQAFYRAQITICAVTLGPVTTALFLYSKQIINALGQLVLFMRRIEFPQLVAQANFFAHQLPPKPVSLLSTLRHLRVSLLAALAMTAATSTVALWPTSDADLSAVTTMVALLSPLVLSGSIYSALAQGILAFGAYMIVAKVAWLVLAIGLSLSLALTPWGPLGLVTAEILAHMAGGLLILRAYFEKRTIRHRE